jgi:ribosomal protein L40E
MAANSTARRIRRMLADPRFWWSVLFGAGTITVSLWYAGLRQEPILALLGGAWCMIAVCMNYGATLIPPSSRCRRCGYDLISQIHICAADGRITCPECGSRWLKGQFEGALAPAAAPTR